MALTFTILPGRFSVCKLRTGAIPAWALTGSFYSITRSAAELSIVCLEEYVPAGIQAEHGWRALQVQGPLDFALIGILARIAGVLAQAGISIFAISTYDTDTILVKDEALQEAAAALRQNGCVFAAAEGLD